jgi:hypothetical protein
MRGSRNGQQPSRAQTGERTARPALVEGIGPLAAHDQGWNAQRCETGESVDAVGVLVNLRLDPSRTVQLVLTVRPLERPLVDIRAECFVRPRVVRRTLAKRLPVRSRHQTKRRSGFRGHGLSRRA